MGVRAQELERRREQLTRELMTVDRELTTVRRQLERDAAMQRLLEESETRGAVSTVKEGGAVSVADPRRGQLS